MAKRITEYTNIETVAENDVLLIVDVSDTEQATTGSTRKGTIEKIADYLKARVETLTNKTISGGTIDGADISGGTIASDTNVVEILKKVYPVGCIYISSVSTSPATLFGFGTWTLVGEGKALFGVDSGDSDFNTSEKTGGAKTHEHTLSDNGYAKIYIGAANARGRLVTGVESWTSTRENSGGSTASQANTDATPLDGETDSKEILPPYYTAYFYKRTA